MSYQVLARKYRPQRFSDVIGQDHVTRTLKNAIEQERIAHGYIFSGHRGIGKTTIARILAMALNCRASDRPNPEPCGQCESCQEVRAGSSVDVIEIDAATNRGIDEIRELRDAARYRPARDRYKIYILDEAHQITEAAFNALLKTLEEPPDHVIFMMATTQPEDIPQTIRSRCQHFSFHAVGFEDIVSQLRNISEKEGIRADPEALSAVAEAGDGSMRDALSIMDQAIAGSGIASGEDTMLAVEQVRGLVGTLSTEVFEEIMIQIAANAAAEVLKVLDRLLTEGTSPAHFARQFVRFLRNGLIAGIAGIDSPLLQISRDERNRVRRVAELFGEEEMSRFLNIMLRTYDDIGYRQEQRFHLELGVLKLVHAQRLLPFEQLLSQSSRLSGVSPAATPGAARTPAAQPDTPSSSAPRPSADMITASTPPSTGAPRSISPFEADRARKGVVKSENSRVTGASSDSGIQTSGLAAVPAVAVQDNAMQDTAARDSPEPQFAAFSNSDPPAVDQVKNAIVAALEAQGHPSLAGLIEEGVPGIKGSELEITIAATAVLIDISATSEAKRIMNMAASSSAARALTVKLLSGGRNNGFPKAPPRNGNGTIAVDKALEEPLVKRMQEKFGARVLKVIDLRQN